MKRLPLRRWLPGVIVLVLSLLLLFRVPLYSLFHSYDWRSGDRAYYSGHDGGGDYLVIDKSETAEGCFLLIAPVPRDGQARSIASTFLVCDEDTYRQVSAGDRISCYFSTNCYTHMGYLHSLTIIEEGQP